MAGKRGRCKLQVTNGSPDTGVRLQLTFAALVVVLELDVITILTGRNHLHGMQGVFVWSTLLVIDTSSFFPPRTLFSLTAEQRSHSLSSRDTTGKQSTCEYTHFFVARFVLIWITAWNEATYIEKHTNRVPPADGIAIFGQVRRKSLRGTLHWRKGVACFTWMLYLNAAMPVCCKHFQAQLPPCPQYNVHLQLLMSTYVYMCTLHTVPCVCVCVPVHVSECKHVCTLHPVPWVCVPVHVSKCKHVCTLHPVPCVCVCVCVCVCQCM